MSGWVFFQLARDQSGIRSREGALYNTSALQGYLILMFETYRLTIDIQVFDRENNENVVDVLPFLLSRRIARFFMEDLPVPLIFSIITYWMSGLRADTSAFFIYFSIVLLSMFYLNLISMKTLFRFVLTRNLRSIYRRHFRDDLCSCIQKLRPSITNR